MGEIAVSKVADLRKRAGITQRELAAALGVTEATVRNWENNRSNAELFVRFAKLCDTLHCAPRDLYEMKEVPSEEG